ncbi:hypothetical protein NPA31_018240 [Aurantimonas sp. MSK8Z-1]|uniref:hypothetical protein n=1 Tax=Mangrovibrevibacter kandeliae TaxID=2968473 RepID=UPI00222E8C59|nr:hypothetical protein [Aurantimonas sp. MSK8Z-1]MCW4116902.1 hypothetical protein [Aurantimonas sp. MSK8Z-1]
MLRLLAVSVGTLIFGVMAVLGAIVYKVNRPAPADRTLAETKALPADAVIDLPTPGPIRQIALDGDRALALVGEGADERLLVIDLATGAVAARYTLRRP